MNKNDAFPWLWDVPLNADAFVRLLRGGQAEGGLDGKWAMARLIEYAPYRQILQLLPRDLFLKRWPEVAPRVRSVTRREGMAYLYQRWLNARNAA